MRILLTNDDGIHAPGLRLLHDVAARFGELWVVAPDRERSGISHAITLNRALRLEELSPGWVACDGTPTDCVNLAINHMKLDVDLVLSGVNPGPNLAQDVLYSGTVSATMEAAHWGVAAVALSHCSGDTGLLPYIKDVLAAVLGHVIPIATELRRAVNVNFPPADRLPYKGIVAASLGHRSYSSEVHERKDPRGRLYYWIGGANVTMNDMPGSDCNAVRDNYVSVTPLGDDLTLHDRLDTVRDRLHEVGTSTLGDGELVSARTKPTARVGIPFE